MEKKNAKKGRSSPFLSSSEVEEKKRKHTKKKVIERKENANKGGSLPFLFSFFEAEEKKKHRGKKNHKEEKKCK
jgi:hypothetical protein